MGAFADSLFTLLLGWVRGLVSAIMTLFSSGGENGMIPFLGKNWLVIVLTILAIGLVGDWFIWMLRWQPYRVWGTNMRRIARALHLRPQREEEDAVTEEASYAPPQEDEMGGTRLYQRAAQPEQTESPDYAQAQELELPPLTPDEEAEAYAAAEQAPDAQEYPGMHYDMSAYMRPQPEVEADETDYAPEEDDAPVNPDFDDGESDAEWAQEIDPLASYDDPQVLSRLAQEPVYEEPVYEEAEQDMQEEAPRRRRRRRRSEAE